MPARAPRWPQLARLYSSAHSAHLTQHRQRTPMIISSALASTLLSAKLGPSQTVSCSLFPCLRTTSDFFRSSYDYYKRRTLTDRLLTPSQHLVNGLISSGLPDSRRPSFALTPPRLKQIHSWYVLYDAAVSKLGQLRLPQPLLSMRYAWVMSPGSIHRGKKHDPTPSASTLL